MTSEFCELRDRCGLRLEDVAAEFGKPLDLVLLWEKGDVSPPERVLRSLSIMAEYSSRPTAGHQSSARSDRSNPPPHTARLTPRQRKSQLGQFLTPPSVAKFMAALFDQPAADGSRLLDAGAGNGALTTAFLKREEGKSLISATVFEYDEKIIPELRANLAAICSRAGAEWELIEGDFIEHAANRVCLGKGVRYSHAILNPPYKKIANDSHYRALLRTVGLETVNLYSGFVGLALELLEPGGELVAIIPRSFCNGPYYQPFRQFVLRRAAIRHIHLFHARNKAFREDGVLQENIIIKLVRGVKQGSVTISTSTDGSFLDYTEKNHPIARIIFPDDVDMFIHIPTGDDEQLLERPSFGHDLAHLGLTVSTGPVVDFRLRNYLHADPELGTVPLLYPGHFGPDGMQWPRLGFKKPNAIRDTAVTRKWLYPNGYYAVVRRFSSKEERRRIIASVIEPSRLRAEVIGIENHLNVFHANRRPIPERLARGLAIFLNSTAVDTYFRRFNGHTQVNATDLRAMRYPNRESLIALGEWSLHSRGVAQNEIDERISTL